MLKSQHELIRGNVLTATRYFQHRVKNFIDKVMLGKNNPMNVKTYTYKVEFQDRGAGHIHGTLWLRLDKLEQLKRGEDGKLIAQTNEQKSENNPEKFPLKGLEKAFTKIRKNEKLEYDDITPLKEFIDEFTTVSIHENTVGKALAKIAKKVKQRHAATTLDSQCLKQ